MMETQLAQIAEYVSHLFIQQGHLLGQPEENPKGHMSYIALRSGKQIDEPKAILGEEGEGFVKNKSKEPMKENDNLVSRMLAKTSNKKSPSLGRLKAKFGKN